MPHAASTSTLFNDGERMARTTTRPSAQAEPCKERGGAAGGRSETGAGSEPETAAAARGGHKRSSSCTEQTGSVGVPGNVTSKGKGREKNQRQGVSSVWPDKANQTNLVSCWQNKSLKRPCCCRCGQCCAPLRLPEEGSKGNQPTRIDAAVNWGMPPSPEQVSWCFSTSHQSDNQSRLPCG